MILKTISVTYDRKLNLGDFNSLHASITLWADLEDGDDEVLAMTALKSMARNNVVAEMKRAKPELSVKVEELFMGLPKDLQKVVEDNV